MTRVFRTSSFRLSAIYAALFALSMGILFAIVYLLASNLLRDQMRVAIEDEMRDLTAIARQAPLDKLIAEINDRASDEPRHEFYFGLHDAAGHLLAGDLPVAPRGPGWQQLRVPSQSTSGVSDDTKTSLYVQAEPVRGRRIVSVGLDSYRVEEAQEAIVVSFGWAAAAGIVLALAGGALLSRGFLSRLDAMNQAMGRIVAGHLDERLTVRETDDELDRLGRNFNEMLDRLQASMEGLKQVSSDVAHDLRTPLSRLRQRLEDARDGSQGQAGYAAAIDQAIEDTDAILTTFTALLRIAEVEAGSRRAAFEEIDLSALFEMVVDSFAAVAEDHGHSLTAEVAPGIGYFGDKELLTQMMVNLVVNAILHTPAGTEIALSLAPGPNGPTAVVADNGPGIPDDAADKVFRRFFRLEGSRTTPGSGLGLPLVAAVAGLHGIAVELSDNEPGLKVTLAFGAPERG